MYTRTPLIASALLAASLFSTHSYAATQTDTIHLNFNELIGPSGTATFYITSGYLQAHDQPGLPEFYMNEISLNTDEVLLPISSESGDWACYPTASCVLTSTTSPITSSAITDGDINTGIVLLGGEATNANNIYIEYPAFAKFDFNLDRSLGSMVLNVATSSNVRNGIGGNTWFGFLNHNTNQYEQFYSSFDADIANGIDTFSVTMINTSAVPEASTYGMMLAGLGLVGFMARRRKLAKV